MILSSKTIISFSLLLSLFLLEYLLPFFKNQKHKIFHGINNILLSILNGLLTGIVFTAVTLKVIKISELHQIGLAYHLNLPSSITFIIVFLLFDLWMYFWHLINHRVSLLWQFHTVHHTDTQMDVTTAHRFHPVEMILSSCIRLSIIGLIGIKIEQLIIYEIVLNINIMIHHSNIALPAKIDWILRYLIVTPNMHRVHHSIEWKQTHSNYSTVFSFWDRLFQTYIERKDPDTIKFGLQLYRDKKSQNIIGMLSTPFRKFSFKLFILKR